MYHTIVYKSWAVPDEFYSDGCTIPSLVKKAMNEENFVNGCRLHDYLRRYALVSVSEGDRIFRDYIYDYKPSVRYYFISRGVYYALKVSRPWFSKTEKIPPKYYLFRFPSFELREPLYGDFIPHAK
jgi:hypothetical protein